jgi:LysM repeat protein
MPAALRTENPVPGVSRVDQNAPDPHCRVVRPMHTAQFIIPSNSPLQRRMPARTPGVVFTVAVIVAAHLLLLGSLLIRGWMRDSTRTGGPREEIGVSLSVCASDSVLQPRLEAKDPVTAVSVSAQTLRPPSPAPRPQPEIPAQAAIDSTLYVAKAGDTLTKIAKLHATTVNAIRLAGELQSDRIAVGQKIRLPATANVPPSGIDRLR